MEQRTLSGGALQSCTLVSGTCHLRLNTIQILLAFQNKTSMKKKEYERPTTQVVQLKQQAYLLQASATGDVNATMDGTWTEETI